MQKEQTIRAIKRHKSINPELTYKAIADHLNIKVWLVHQALKGTPVIRTGFDAMSVAAQVKLKDVVSSHRIFYNSKYERDNKINGIAA